MSDNPYRQIHADHEAAKRGTMPDILVSVYGDKAPDAARFDKGTSTTEGAAEAASARRNAIPGQYDSKRA